MFQLFDEDNSGTISLTELVNGLSVFLHGSHIEKLHFLFKVYDIDGTKKKLLFMHEVQCFFTLNLGNGFIEFKELRTVLKSCMKESAIKLSDFQLDQLTRLFFSAIKIII